MKLGFTGAGDFAQAVAKRALKAAHEVLLSNSRGPDSVREVARQLGAGARAATIEEAAACQMVVLAVPWDRVAETLASLPRWKNQILIDATNPFHGKAGSFTPVKEKTCTICGLCLRECPAGALEAGKTGMLRCLSHSQPFGIGGSVAFWSRFGEASPEQQKAMLQIPEYRSTYQASFIGFQYYCFRCLAVCPIGATA